ncbi:MAG: restriction endonuclease subunit S [Thermodesulfobacteriota bacterium]|nr:restriction endonuclease subunit S [Thermodesulfobacteriota bacterium]
MNLQTFYDHFEYLADAPNGVTKLREMILQLAVQGKLVPQDPKDEPASVLLEKIKAEKEKLIKQGKIKKSKPLPPLTPEEVPYELPEGWGWVRLGDIAILENGDRSKRYPKENDFQNSGIPFFGAKDMVDGMLRFDNGLRFISKTKFDELRNGKLIDNDFVVLLRGSVGKTAIFRASCEFTTGFINAQMLIIRLLNKSLCEFFNLYSKSVFFQSSITDKTTGSAVKQMPANVLLNFLIPFPALSEQHRIASKVDQLMALCDELETRQQKKETARARLNQSITANLLTAPTPKAFTTGWQRLCHNFDLLYDTPETIPTLRQTILQLAVQGKLVPQDPNDEPASVLLEKINAEKEKLIKQGKIKKSKPLPPVTPEEMPYELPKGWEWTRLGNVGRIIGGGTPKTSEAEYFTDNCIPWLTPADLYQLKGKYISKGKRDITDLGLKKSSAQLMPKNTVIFSSRAPIGYVAIAANELCTNQGFKSCVPYILRMNEYIYYFLRCMSKEIDKNASGTTFKEVSGKIVSEILISIPPLAEQLRIVTEIDQIMDLCDHLEEKLTQSADNSQRLTEAVIHHLTAA